MKSAALKESRLGVEQKRRCWIPHWKQALQFLISASQQTHWDGGFDIISRGGRTAGRGEVYYFIMWNTIPTATLSHWKIKPSDNSLESGPRPRTTPAQFYKQVDHRHRTSGSTFKQGFEVFFFFTQKLKKWHQLCISLIRFQNKRCENSSHTTRAHTYEGYKCQNKMSQPSVCSSNVTETHMTSSSLATLKK